jgi:hypothetical protein
MPFRVQPPPKQGLDSALQLKNNTFPLTFNESAMRFSLVLLSGLTASLVLAACGGGSSSTTNNGGGNGGGGGSAANGTLTISNANPSSLNGTCSAGTITPTTTGVYVNRQVTLSCGASSKLSFIIDTSTTPNKLIDGDTIVTLTNTGAAAAYCSGSGGNCPQVSLDANAKKLTFTNQTYAGNGISFTVNGNINY